MAHEEQIKAVQENSGEVLRAIKSMVDPIMEELAFLKDLIQTQSLRMNSMVYGTNLYRQRLSFNFDLGSLHDVSHEYRLSNRRFLEGEIWDIFTDIVSATVEEVSISRMNTRFSESLFCPTLFTNQEELLELFQAVWKCRPDDRSLTGTKWVVSFQVESHIAKLISIGLRKEPACVVH